MRILGFNQLAGRFVWLSLAVVLSLLAITFYAQILVHQSTSEGTRIIDNDRKLSSTLNGLNTSLQTITTQVYQYTTQLDQKLAGDIAYNITHLQQELLEFASHDVIQSDQQSRQQTDKLQAAECRHVDPGGCPGVHSSAIFRGVRTGAAGGRV